MIQLPPQAQPSSAIPQYVHWPIYSAVALAGGAAMPRTVDFFNYALGQTVTGAGGGAVVSTPFHTNMENENALAAPKTFSIFGIRLVLMPLSYASGNPALSDPSSGGALGNDDNADDQVLLLSSWFEFRQGQIDEAFSPAFAVPGNVGVGGVLGASLSQTNAAPLHKRMTAPHTAGVAWKLDSYPVVLWDSQFFTARMRHEWATSYTVLDHKYLFCVFDGILAREIQA